MSYIIPLVHFGSKSCVRFCHSRDDFIQFTFCESSSFFFECQSIAVTAIVTIALAFAVAVVLLFRNSIHIPYSHSHESEYFVWMYFIFWTLLLNLTCTFYRQRKQSANVGEKKKAQRKKVIQRESESVRTSSHHIAEVSLVRGVVRAAIHVLACWISFCIYINIIVDFCYICCAEWMLQT